MPLSSSDLGLVVVVAVAALIVVVSASPSCCCCDEADSVVGFANNDLDEAVTLFSLKIFVGVVGRFFVFVVVVVLAVVVRLAVVVLVFSSTRHKER